MQTQKKRKLQKLTFGFKEHYNPKKKKQTQQQEDLEEEKQDISEEDNNDQKEMDKFDLKYEDDFDDEYEQEEIINAKDQENEWVSDEETTSVSQKQKQQTKNKNKNIEDEKEKITPWLGTNKNLQKDEVLDFDNRAYEMFHRATLEWPCLSCDFILPLDQQFSIKNPSFKQMKDYPLKIFLALGTQTSEINNYIYLLNWNNLHKTKYDDDSDNNSDDEENIQNDEEATLDVQEVLVKSSINRIRTMNYMPIVAFWSENGEFTIMDLKNKFSMIGGDPQTDPKSVKNNKMNIKTFKNTNEGFALDWNQNRLGYLASGSCDNKIYIYKPNNENFTDIIRDDKPYLYHKASVEDICWSPFNETILASCSVDQTIQIMDLRQGNRKQSQLLIKAHDCDINVISWCKVNKELIASGGDDGTFKIWDIRFTSEPYSEFHFHKEPITSIQFAPNSDSVLTVQSEDNRVTIWDLAAENEDNQIQDEINNIPDQLMFIHQGQTEMKEIRYHPIYFDMVVSTSGDSLHVFKPNLDEQSSVASKEDKQDQIPIIQEKQLDEYLSKMNLNE